MQPAFSHAELPIHFIFGLSDAADELSFTFSNFLAVRAAHVHLRPARLLFHYHHKPRGQWWPHARKLVRLHRVRLVRSIFGHPLRHAAHRADILRLQLLIRHGGIYLDLDVIVLRPMAPLLNGAAFVIGREGDEAHGGFHGLCNAVLLAKPNASFLVRWLEEYRTFGEGDGDPWSEHSVQRPVALAAAHPDEVRVLPFSAFFWPDWDPDQLRKLLLERSDPLSHLHAAAALARGTVTPNQVALEADLPSAKHSGVAPDAALPAAYAVHLWSSLATPFVLRQWSAEYLSSVPSALNCLLQTEFSPLPHMPPSLPNGLERNCSCHTRRKGPWASRGADLDRERWEHALIGQWPLRRPPHSPRLLVDTSGNCNHGWVYSSCSDSAQPGCWWGAGGMDVTAFKVGVAAVREDSWGLTSSDEPTALSVASPIEAFVPLPPSCLASGEWTISWWALIHSRSGECASRVPFWALALDDHSVFRAFAENDGGRLLPKIEFSPPGRSWLWDRSVLVSAYGTSICSNGWHHYTAVVSSATQTLALYLDGSLWASAPWTPTTSTGTSTGTGTGTSTGTGTGTDAGGFSAVRGLWVASESLAAITAHTPLETAQGEMERSRMQMTNIGLFAARLQPTELPRGMSPAAEWPQRSSAVALAAQRMSWMLCLPLAIAGAAAVGIVMFVVLRQLRFRVARRGKHGGKVGRER